VKPWEQEWGQFNLDARVVTRSHDGLVVADPRGDSHAETVGLAQFISAAPDMARALMMTGGVHHGEWHANSCWIAPFQPCNDKCRAAREALRKAGVLP